MRRAWKSFAVLLAFAVLAGLAADAALAQDAGRIEGALKAPGGKPLAGVSVSIVETGAKTRTDAAGAFAFANVAPGTYTVLYNYEQLADTEPQVVVAAGTATRIDRELDWNLAFQESITVVSASRAEERITEAPAAITALPVEEIEIKAATGQLPKLFEFTPGAEVTQSGLYDYNLNTRGFNSSLNRRVATLIDGRDRRCRSSARRSGRRSRSRSTTCRPPRWCAARRRRSTVRTPRAACSTW